MKLALFAAAATLAPLLLLRGRARPRFFGIAAGFWLIAGFLALAARPLHVEIDPYVATIACGVLHVAGFWAFVALQHETALRWTATRAAVAAGLFYIAAIP